MSLCNKHLTWTASISQEGLCETCARLESNHNSRITALEQENKRLQRIVDQVDDALVVDWITVKDGNYTEALSDLISYSIQIYDDPQVS